MMEDSGSQLSFKEKLLKVFGESRSDEEIWWEDEEDFLENKWYKEEEPPI